MRLHGLSQSAPLAVNNCKKILERRVAQIAAVILKKMAETVTRVDNDNALPASCDCGIQKPFLIKQVVHFSERYQYFIKFSALRLMYGNCICQFKFLKILPVI